MQRDKPMVSGLEKSNPAARYASDEFHSPGELGNRRMWCVIRALGEFANLQRNGLGLQEFDSA
jgi:hypothetical protein